MPSILVVDDDEKIRELISKYLGGEGFSVMGAASALAAEPLVAAADLLVIDKMMPVKNGFDWLAELRAVGDDTPAIMLTAAGDLDSRIDGLSRGADDYLAKPFDPKELLLRITAILRRLPPKGVIRLGLKNYNTITGEIAGETLTESARDMLNYLVQRAGKNVSRDELATVFKQDYRSIDVAITRLRAKVEEDNKTPKIILTVRNIGYRIVL